MTKGRRDHDNSYVKINGKNRKFLLSLIIADNVRGRLAQRETVRLRIQQSEFDSPPKQMDVFSRRGKLMRGRFIRITFQLKIVQRHLLDLSESGLYTLSLYEKGTYLQIGPMTSTS